MRKKIALFMSIVVLCASSSSVYGAETNSMPRALACGKCQGGRLFEKMVDRTWSESSKCSHQREGWEDTHYWLGHYSVFECSSCHSVSDGTLITRDLIKLTCGPKK